MSNKHKAMIGGAILAFLLFIFLGFKPVGDVSYGGSWYDAGSVFLPEKYTTGWGGTSLYADRGVDWDMNSRLAGARFTILFPMILCLAGIGGVSYLLNKDQEFQDKVYQYYYQIQKGEVK